MRHERHTVFRAPTRGVERDLVNVLDENVRPPLVGLAIGPVGEKGERVPRADAIDLDTVERRAWRTVRPTTAEQTDSMAFRGETAEDLVKMNFGPARLRILAILPVHEKEAHLHASHSTRERVQHPVHELRAFDGPVPFRQAHCFLDDDARWRLTTPKLRGA